MGHVVGGWEYVWSAYGITFVALLGYSVALWRRRKEK